jgi:ADP-ribose pyrophosphatase
VAWEDAVGVDNRSRPLTQARDWQAINHRLLVDRSPYAQIFEHDVIMPGGQTIPNWIDVELPTFGIMFALLDDGHVVFVRQYRQAVSDYTLELPAGHLDVGEDPLVGARRELREESGFEASEWAFLGSYVMDANRGCGWAYTYLARGACQVAAPNHGDVGDLGVQLLTLDETRKLWSSGSFLSAPTSLCIGLALNALGRIHEVS